MTIEHTLLGVYLLTVAGGITCGMVINIFMVIFKHDKSGAFGSS